MLIFGSRKKHTAGGMYSEIAFSTFEKDCITEDFFKLVIKSRLVIELHMSKPIETYVKSFFKNNVSD